MYTTQTVLLERNGWRLTSYGNGAAYLLEDTALGKSVFFQCEEADAFRDEVMTDGGWLRPTAELIFAQYSEVME